MNNGAATTNGHAPAVRPPTLREMAVFNHMLRNEIDWRRESLAGYFGDNWDKRRDIYSECRYPKSIKAKEYKFMYERNGVAARVNDIYPDECWALEPAVYESEDTSETTAFEKAWNELTSVSEEPDGDTNLNVIHYLHRLDQVSGIGRFGLMFLGLDDGRNWAQIVPGINEKGMRSGQTAKHKLLYLRTFDETQVEIKEFQRKQNNPRNGLPLYYEIDFVDPNETNRNGSVNKNRQIVHWSRVIHFGDALKTNEVYGTPRQKSVFNWLLDFQKVIGGAGEMFYKGGFPGLFLQSYPELGQVTVDKEKTLEEVALMQEGLQRALLLTGMEANLQAPAVASPEYHIRGILNAIAIAKGIPTRIFMGSEEAKLSSTQDGLTWNKRLRRRQTRELTPNLLREFVRRLIMFGVVPRPRRVLVDWPDLNTLTDEEKATIAQKRAQALATYVSGNVEAVMEFKHFMTEVMGLSMRQAEVILAAAKKQVRLTEDPADVAMRQAMLKVTAAATNKTNTPGRGGKTTGSATKPKVAKAKARPTSRPK